MTLGRFRLAFTTTAAIAATWGASACEKSDLGKTCGTVPTEISDPIGGEVPTIEVVRMERDGDCESFQCLTHRGLSPYCTQTCEIDTPPNKQKTCTLDDDCKGGEFASGQVGHCVAGKCTCELDEECDDPLQCSDGRCRDDDCPEGYWCKTVQDVGPLAGQRFCVFREGCQANGDCEDFSTMSCKKLGCFDACLRGYHSCTVANSACVDLECYAPCPRVAPEVHYCPGNHIASASVQSCIDAGCFDKCEPLGPDCQFHRLVCEPRSGLGCDCTGANQSSDIERCPNANLVCQPDSTAAVWPAGTVEKLNVCQPK